MIRGHFTAAVPGPIVSYVNFTFSCFVHNHRFCFLQDWCPTVFASSGHRVLLEFGLQDTLSCKLIKKCATLAMHCRSEGVGIKTGSGSVGLLQPSPLAFTTTVMLDALGRELPIIMPLWLYTWHPVSIPTSRAFSCSTRSDPLSPNERFGFTRPLFKDILWKGLEPAAAKLWQGKGYLCSLSEGVGGWWWGRRTMGGGEGVKPHHSFYNHSFWRKKKLIRR